MKPTTFLASAALAIGLAGPALAQHMPLDEPVTQGDVTAVCTGIGHDAQTDPRWKAYPVRIEFSNGAAQYLAGAHVTLASADGKTLADGDCDGAWVLYQLAPGRYTVTATLLDHPDHAPSSATFSPPSSGQKRVVLEFKGLDANH